MNDRQARPSPRETEAKREWQVEQKSRVDLADRQYGGRSPTF